MKRKKRRSVLDDVLLSSRRLHPNVTLFIPIGRGRVWLAEKPVSSCRWLVMSDELLPARLDGLWEGGSWRLIGLMRFNYTNQWAAGAGGIISIMHSFYRCDVLLSHSCTFINNVALIPSMSAAHFIVIIFIISYNLILDGCGTSEECLTALF